MREDLYLMKIKPNHGNNILELFMDHFQDFLQNPRSLL